MRRWFAGWKSALARGWAVEFWLAALVTCHASSAIPFYVVQSWQTEDGLPQSDVTAALQTRDGYLWIGTYDGLARFDGVRFVVFQNQNTPEMRSPVVTSLFEQSNGTLWTGYVNGEITQYKDGHFTRTSARGPWSGQAIIGIAADAADDVWLLTGEGKLIRFRDEKVLMPEPGPGARWSGLVVSKPGVIWVLRNGRVSRLSGGRLEILAPEIGRTNSFVQGIASSSDGGLWVMCDGRLRKWQDERWSDDLGPAPWGYGPTPQFIESKDGWLEAAVYDHGFVRWKPRDPAHVLSFDRAHGFASDWVTTLFEDREGNLWAGTGGAGIHKVRTTPVESVSPPDLWRGRSVSSVSAATDGGLWIGTGGSGLYHFKNGIWTNYDQSSGLASLYVWSAVEDTKTNLWVATWGGGLFREQGGRFEPVPGLEDIKVPMTAIYCGAGDRVWVGTEEGLMLYQGRTAEWVSVRKDPAERSVRSVIEGADGRIWFGIGMLGGGLGCLEDGVLRQFHKEDGIAGNFVSCLHMDKEGTLWIGISGGGLTRCKNGRFSVINQERGLPNDFICDIEEDNDGYFWMSSHYGIFRVRKADVDRCADGDLKEVNCVTYEVGDGLPTLECSGGMQPAGCKTGDGRLWFPTTKGVVGIDPSRVVLNPVPPPVVVEDVRVDGHLVTGDRGSQGRLRIEPGRHRLDFRYTALSFAVPDKVRFKHRLEGLDSSWVDTGTQRTYTYSYIPPGAYRFHVAACNNDGIWNETGAELSFVVLPYFWQTLWFRLLMGSAVIGLSAGGVWLAMRRRLRRKLERLERQRAIERERARIAQDIHDDLGASLTRISLLSQLARSDLGKPDLAATELDRIYETARDVTRAMDEIVWAVNPRHDTLDSLASYLSKYAQDYVRAARIRCSFGVPTHLPAWPVGSELRHNLFLAMKEALHNVVRHSEATEVYVGLTLGPDAFALVVEDNGRGYAPGSTGAGTTAGDQPRRGNGLENMRRRLSEIGGKFEISRLGTGGTRVMFEVKVAQNSMEPGEHRLESPDSA